MLTYNQLLTGTYNLRPNQKYINEKNITNVGIKYSNAKKILYFKADVRGAKGELYTVHLGLFDISERLKTCPNCLLLNYEHGYTGSTDFLNVVSARLGNKRIFVAPSNLGISKDIIIAVRPNIGNSKVKVRCSCPDYRFTWHRWNKKGGSDMGPDFPVYIPTGMRPPRNELKVPGMCKHIEGVTQHLLKLKWFN